MKVDEHTKLDLEHHADVRAAIVRVEGKIDGMEIERDRSPAEAHTNGPRLAAR